MTQADLKILIVEDDIHLGRVIEKALKEEGYQTFFVSQPEKALSLAKDQNFDCAVVDCLLPKINGIQLLQELKKIKKGLRSVLITGVYKDKSFFQEALSKTDSYDLLLKPFEMKHLFLTLEHLFSDLLNKTRRLSLEFFTQESLKRKNIKSVFLKEKNFSGFELPYIYSFFFQTQLTGLLNLTYEDSNLVSVRFKEGSLIDIQSEDKNSYFGALLVENGFISSQDLEKALERKREKPLGEELVDVNMLSPHMIRIIQRQQAQIRLSKSIKAEDLKIDFIEASPYTEKGETNVTVVDSLEKIESQQFPKLLNEWILSKITLDWLKSFVLPWCNHIIEPAPSFSDGLKFQSLPLFSSEEEKSKELIRMIKEKHPLKFILESSKEKESFVLRALYFLLICKFVVFKERDNIELDEDKELENLKNILRDVKEKNHFQFFGISQNATSIDVKKAYYHLANVLHPDRLHSQMSKKFKSFSYKVFSHILIAYNVLKDEESRKKYLEKIQKTEMKSKIKIKERFDQACSLLYSHQHQEAYKILHALKVEKASLPHFICHYIWALIKSEKYKILLAEKDLIPYLESLIHEIPSEERHNENYFYMISLFHKLNQKIDLSQKYLKQALILNPDFPILKDDLKNA